MTTPEDQYQALPLETLKLEKISFDDFIYLRRKDIDEICDEAPRDFRGVILRLWEQHPRNQVSSVPQPQDDMIFQQLERFWAAINSRPLIEANNKLMFTVDDMDPLPPTWGIRYSSTSSLLIRAEYLRIIQELTDNLQFVLLRGTKGIGKSLFIYYFIYKKIMDAQHNGSALPTFGLHLDINRRYFLTFDNSKPIVRSVGLNFNPDYYISDRVYDINATPKKFNLLVHSFGASNIITEFVDAIGNASDRGKIVTMGVLPYEEVMSLANNSNKKGELAYLIFGGSARCLSFMFQEIKEDRKWYPVVLEQLRLFLEGSRFCKKRFEEDVKQCAKIIAEKLQLAGADETRDARSIENSLFRHIITYPDSTYETTFASTFMAFLAGYIIEEVDKNILKELRRILEGSGMGCLFERRVHTLLWENYRNRGTLEVKRLYPKSSRKLTTDDYKAIKVTVKRKVFVRTIEDIEKLQEEEYGVPSVPNFPLVDFIIKPNIQGQMTISNRHSGAIHRHHEIVTAMGSDSSKQKMIFFCDTGNFDKFSRVEGLVKGVKQYKMLCEWTTNNPRPPLPNSSPSQQQPSFSSGQRKEEDVKEEDSSLQGEKDDLPLQSELRKRRTVAETDPATLAKRKKMKK